MSSFALLGLLMAAVTYPARALFLVLPQANRLPRKVEDYLRLVGPAVLAALAGTSLAVETNGARSELVVGPEWLAVGVTIVIVARTRNLLVGLVVAILLTAGLRALGWSGIPLG